MTTYPSNSTYTAPYTVTDNDGSTFDLNNADNIEWAITRSQGGDTDLLYYQLSDPEISITDAVNGKFEVVAPASDITFVGTVWEEVRVTLPNSSKVINQRAVTFDRVAIES